MTDRQLMGFLTIVEKKSFTAAAEAMYISQSALSQQILHLERQLGFALFDRSFRQPTLTEAGRSFYAHAAKLQALYTHAVAEGRQLQAMREQHIKRFMVGCLGEQFILIWKDLLDVALPLARSYAPCPVRYPSKEALYAALLRGEAQIAALLEHEDIRRFGLEFLPFARVPELAMPCGLPLSAQQWAQWGGRPVRPEELSGVQLAFHNQPGANLYEDQLRTHLRNTRQPYVDPQDFPTASLQETVLLVPAVEYGGRAPTLTLDWEGGSVLGFVTAQGGDPKVLAYADYIRAHLPARAGFWTPLR